MSRQPEGVIKDACRALAKKHGLLFENIESKSRRGWPDTEAGLYPRGSGTCKIEFKTPAGVVDRQQEIRHAELREHGCVVHVCRSVDEYREAVGL